MNLYIIDDHRVTLAGFETIVNRLNESEVGAIEERYPPSPGAWRRDDASRDSGGSSVTTIPGSSLWLERAPSDGGSLLGSWVGLTDLACCRFRLLYRGLLAGRRHETPRRFETPGAVAGGLGRRRPGVRVARPGPRGRAIVASPAESVPERRRRAMVRESASGTTEILNEIFVHAPDHGSCAP
jgi:hypothetical protein